MLPSNRATVLCFAVGGGNLPKALWQMVVPGLSPPAWRASPEIAALHSARVCRSMRGAKVFPQTSILASFLILFLQKSRHWPLRDLLKEYQGTFPFLFSLFLSLFSLSLSLFSLPISRLHTHKDEQSSTETTKDGFSPPVSTTTFIPLHQFFSHVPPSTQDPTNVSFPLPQLPLPQCCSKEQMGRRNQARPFSASRFSFQRGHGGSTSKGTKGRRCRWLPEASSSPPLPRQPQWTILPQPVSVQLLQHSLDTLLGRGGLCSLSPSENLWCQRPPGAAYSCCSCCRRCRHRATKGWRRRRR